MMRLGLGLAALLGCGCAGDGADTGATDDTGGFCADAPVLTWDNFGAGFTTENCQPCHASTAVNRYGAPDTVVFDTYADTMAQAERVRVRVLGDQDVMPPQGGVGPDDKVRLEYWLVCGEGL